MLDVWMDLKGFDFEWQRLWVISNHVPHQNRLFNSTALFVVHKWPLTIEDVVIKLDEIKLKCLKFCSLNIVDFFAR